MASFVANGMIFLVFTIFRRFLAWKPFTIIATAPYAVSKVDAEVSNQKEKLLNYMITTTFYATKISFLHKSRLFLLSEAE